MQDADQGSDLALNAYNELSTLNALGMSSRRKQNLLACRQLVIHVLPLRA